MEMETRTMRMLLQSMSRTHFALTFIVAIGVWVVSIVIGAVGPHVREVQSFSSYDCSTPNSEFGAGCAGVKLTQEDSQWIGKYGTVDRLNQQLFFVATVENRFSEKQGFGKEVDFSVSVYGRNKDIESGEASEWNEIVGPKGDGELHNHTRKVSCDQHDKFCDNITLAHLRYIGYNEYEFKVSLLNVQEDDFIGDIWFSWITMNPNFTLFELWWRFTFLLVTFIVVVVFSYKLKEFKWDDWTVEQKWTAVMLFALMGYNNPFFPLEILVTGWFPIFLDQLMVTSFLMFLLLFWLVMFDGIRTESQNRSPLTFYLPKIILIMLLWLCLLTTFVWNELHQLDDPTYQTVSDDSGYVFFYAVVLLFIVIYVFWFVFVLCRTLGESRTVPYLGTRIKVFGGFTLSVIFITIFGIFFDFLGPIKNNAAEFMSFNSLFNLYVWVLAIVYLPSKDAVTETSTKDAIGMVRLEDDMPSHVDEQGEEEHERIELPPDHGEGGSSSSSEEKSKT